MTTNDRSRPHRVLMVALGEASPLTTLGPLEVLDVANRLRRAPLYALRLAGEPRTSVGVGLVTQPLDEIDGTDTLILGGGPAGIGGPRPQRLAEPTLAQLARLAAGARRVVSMCSGAFVLGDLGLLEDRRCTTHWLWVDGLKRTFPAAKVEPDAIYTEDGPVWTSAGASAALDLTVQLVRRDGGPRLAQAVARGLVMFVQRPGGQSQFGAALRLDRTTSERLRALLVEVSAHPEADHAVPALAQRAGMSPRNFSRVFLAETGVTPGAFVARVRVEAAQRLLTDSDRGLADIAAACGFGVEASLRRAFRKITGVGPGEWRARFRTS